MYVCMYMYKSHPYHVMYGRDIRYIYNIKITYRQLPLFFLFYYCSLNKKICYKKRNRGKVKRE